MNQFEELGELIWKAAVFVCGAAIALLVYAGVAIVAVTALLFLAAWIL